MKLLFIKIFIILFVTFSSVSFALDSDKKQPIELDADQANINEKTGISIFTGNVILKQGTMLLKSDKMTTYSTPQRQLIKLVATQTPASKNQKKSKVITNQSFFSQRPEGEKNDVKAKANKITYTVKSGTILLEQKAIFWQKKNAFRGDKITYNVANNLLDATGKKNTDGKTNRSNRVHITISPQE